MASYVWLLAGLALLFFGSLTLWVIWPLRGANSRGDFNATQNERIAEVAAPGDTNGPALPQPDKQSQLPK